MKQDTTKTENWRTENKNNLGINTYTTQEKQNLGISIYDWLELATDHWENFNENYVYQTNY